VNNINGNNEEAHDTFPPPFYTISDMFMGWVHKSATIFGIPTLVFHILGVFDVSSSLSMLTYMPQKKMDGNNQYFDVPELSFDLKLWK